MTPIIKKIVVGVAATIALIITLFIIAFWAQHKQGKSVSELTGNLDRLIDHYTNTVDRAIVTESVTRQLGKAIDGLTNGLVRVTRELSNQLAAAKSKYNTRHQDLEKKIDGIGEPIISNMRTEMREHVAASEATTSNRMSLITANIAALAARVDSLATRTNTPTTPAQVSSNKVPIVPGHTNPATTNNAKANSATRTNALPGGQVLPSTYTLETEQSKEALAMERVQLASDQFRTNSGYVPKNSMSWTNQDGSIRQDGVVWIPAGGVLMITDLPSDREISVMPLGDEYKLGTNIVILCRGRVVTDNNAVPGVTKFTAVNLNLDEPERLSVEVNNPPPRPFVPSRPRPQY